MINTRRAKLFVDVYCGPRSALTVAMSIPRPMEPWMQAWADNRAQGARLAGWVKP